MPQNSTMTLCIPSSLGTFQKDANSDTCKGISEMYRTKVGGGEQNRKNG